MSDCLAAGRSREGSQEDPGGESGGSGRGVRRIQEGGSGRGVRRIREGSQEGIQENAGGSDVWDPVNRGILMEGPCGSGILVQSLTVAQEAERMALGAPLSLQHLDEI